jgi:L-alanine-DL-glutamate epimerase-like enolase superfamily enzyme
VKIVSIESWRERVPLTRPYTIAYATIDSVELFFLRVRADTGGEGLGSASPIVDVTGESADGCASFLASERTRWIVGRDIADLRSICRMLASTHREAPAARAALDMALHDLAARALGRPLADLLGRCHDSLPTSVTIGIQRVDEAVAEAREHLARGFTHLKVKVGRSYLEDVERLSKIREAAGRGPRIRIDANQGWNEEDLSRFAPLLEELDVEFVEQPLPARALEAARALPHDLRCRIALDESVVTERDASVAARPPAACGIFNIKLMKCGGVTSALAIAEVARHAGIGLLWGCSDESRVSIAAALHAAFASPATRYLDLDGSLDLARDPATGGFVLEDGRLRTTGEPGLGVTIAEG